MRLVKCLIHTKVIKKYILTIFQYIILQEGLRTLAISMRNISRRDYVKIDEKLTSASQALGDREEQLAKVFDEVEKDLDLLGATAVEDR